MHIEILVLVLLSSSINCKLADEMEVQEYVEKRKEIQRNVLDFINDESEIEFNLHILKKLFMDLNFRKDRRELSLVLRLISKISNNYHHTPTFFAKIEKIILILKEAIQTNLSNSDIFNIFKRNKRILLFLIEENILKPDKQIANIFLSDKYNSLNYPVYFFNEFRSFFSEKVDTIQNIEEICKFKPELFVEKRRIGENHHYISELIRNDSIDEFVAFVNKNNYSLLSKIKTSIFETNSLLNKNTNPSLIEYSVFCGSIQIFKYLFFNKVELTSSLWIYSIHGKNPEIIHFLEENEVVPDDTSYKECLIESIKCHHNDIANYIQNNCFDFNNHDDCFIHSKGIQYNNYEFFPNNLDDLFYLDDLCLFNYASIVKLLVNKTNVNKRIIQAFYIYKVSFPIFFSNKIQNKIYKSSFKIYFVNQIPICIFQMKFIFLFLMKFFIFFFNRTALHIAVDKENKDIVQILLAYPEIDVNIKTILVD